MLVADAYADAAQSLALLLKLWGYDVRVARNGPEALELARAYRPDVALVELVLPQLDGYRLAQQLRGEVVLIALTGLADEASRRRSSEAGFRLHLVKPVEPERLRELLAALGTRAGCPTRWSRSRALAGSVR